MSYNPYREFSTPPHEVSGVSYINIERQPEDEGEDWAFHHRLIKNLLRHREEVADCEVDLDGSTVYVALAGKGYDILDYARIDSQLRQAIGRVACFDYS